MEKPRKGRIRSFWTFLVETYKEWQEDKIPRLAAALAYYTIFSMAPLLVVVIAIISFFLGSRTDVRAALFLQVQGVSGPTGAQAVSGMIQQTSKPAASLIATVIGIVTTLLGATGVFGQLQDSLNIIWEVKARNAGFLGAIKDNFLAFAMVLGAGFLLLVLLIISTLLAGLSQSLGNLVPGTDIFWRVVDFLVSFVITTLLFAMIFKVLPSVKITWKDVLFGAMVTSLLFNIGKILIGQYLGRSSITSAYGAAGSLVIILLWIYYSAQIFFLGAELTQVYARLYGKGIVPSRKATRMKESERIQQGFPHAETVERADWKMPIRLGSHPAPEGHRSESQN